MTSQPADIPISRDQGTLLPLICPCCRHRPLQAGVGGAGATLMTSRLDRTGEWHTTPNIGLTVMLKGWLEIHINRAQPKIFTLVAGDMLFVMDLTGEGHRSRAYGPDGMSALLLPLKASDLASFGQVFKNWPVRS